MELLIVIVVIAILASVSVLAYNGVRARSMEADKAAKFDRIVKGIRNYMTLNGTYPGNLQGEAGAAKIGLTLNDTEPAGFDYTQHYVHGIDGGYSANAGETGFIYLANGRPVPGEGADWCNESPVPCTKFRLAYWSNQKNQEVFIESGSY